MDSRSRSCGKRSESGDDVERMGLVPCGKVVDIVMEKLWKSIYPALEAEISLPGGQDDRGYHPDPENGK